MRHVLLLAVSCIALLAACDGGSDGDGQSTASPTAEATAASPTPTSNEPSSTPTGRPADGPREPTPTRTPIPTPARSPGARSISGLFTDPRPVAQTETRPFPIAPPSPFRLHDGVTVTLYDVAAGTETSYGTGGYVSFSPDGKHLAWTTGDFSKPADLSELKVLHLASRQVRTLGQARTARWLDDGTLMAYLPGFSNELVRVDLETGTRIPVRPEDRPADAPPPIEVGGYRLHFVARTSEYPYWQSFYRLIDLSGRLSPLEFEAYRAVLADDGVLFLATPTAVRRLPDGSPQLESGTSNIFQVDVLSGVATFVATASSSAPNWPFQASERYIAWTDHFCDLPDATDDRLNVLDRRTGQQTTFAVGQWIADVTPKDEIALGAFGARSLLDMDTMQFTFVMPGIAPGSGGAGDVTWTSDYGFAARGFSGGHGGLCG